MKMWVHRFSSKFFARKPITILPRVWFAGAFQVSCAVCKTFFAIYHACWHINQFLAGLHFLSKGMRIVVRSGSIQRCRCTIRGFGFWPIRTHDSDRARSKGDIGHGLVGTRLSCVNRVLFEKNGRDYLKTCTCVVERDEDRRSIWVHPTVQTTIRGVRVLANQNARLRSRVCHGVHQPQFSGHAVFVSEPCAIWKHLHQLTTFFCLNENMSSSFRL